MILNASISAGPDGRRELADMEAARPLSTSGIATLVERFTADCLARGLPGADVAVAGRILAALLSQVRLGPRPGPPRGRRSPRTNGHPPR